MLIRKDSTLDLLGLILVLGLSLCVFATGTVIAQSTVPFHEVRRGSGTSQESIQAFDISPDGKLLALLFQSESEKAGWLRIEIQSVENGIIFKDLKIPVDVRPDRRNFIWYVPHIEFSIDQRFLVIQDWQMIRVLNLSNYLIEKTFMSPSKELPIPYSIMGSASGNVFLLSYGTNVPYRGTFNDMTNPRTYNELIDVSSGRRLPGWESEDLPQSISPDGKLVLISDWSEKKALIEIKIVEASSGQHVRTIQSGYSFKKPWDAGPNGRVVGRFLSNNEVVLSPDVHFDSRGHISGNGFKIFRISDGKVLRDIRPAHFGPTGEMGISPSRSAFFATNWYMTPNEAKHDSAPTSIPEVLIYLDILSKPKTYRISFPETYGLEVNDYLNTYTARVSNDASVLALVLDRGITVFKRQ